MKHYKGSTKLSFVEQYATGTRRVLRRLKACGHELWYTFGRCSSLGSLLVIRRCIQWGCCFDNACVLVGDQFAGERRIVWSVACGSLLWDEVTVTVQGSLCVLRSPCCSSGSVAM